MKKKKFLLIYTLIFAVLSAALILTINLNGKTQICNFDGDGQHIKALIYYSEWIRSIFKNIFVNHKFEIPSWSFSIGYGADIPTSLHYYAVGDPFAVFCVFFPAQHMRFFYEFSIYLRLFCAGLAFSWFCFNKKDLIFPFFPDKTSLRYSRVKSSLRGSGPSSASPLIIGSSSSRIA